MNDQENFYSEYEDGRRISGFALPIVRWWHKRMLKLALTMGFKQGGGGGCLLEVGYGFGIFAKIAESQYDYIAVDGSSSLVKLAIKNNHRVIFGFLPPIPLELNESSFDCIWLSEVLEHARDWQHAKEIIALAHSKLVYGGTLTIISPDISSWKWEFWGEDWTHGFPTTVRRVEQLLREVGFKKITSVTHTLTISYAPFRILIDSVMFFFPWKIVDIICLNIFGRSFGRSFMTLMGFRQIICVAKK